MSARVLPVMEAMRLVRSLVPDRTNQCYVMSEAVYHLAGGKRAGLKPCVHRSGSRGTHWFLRWGENVLDPSVDQFDGLIPDHAKGRGCGFLTKTPSKRAARVIRYAREAWARGYGRAS